jgi:L-asparaginase
VCKKDSTEITDTDREAVCAAVRGTESTRVVITHGTDTMIETARFLLHSGAAANKSVAFTGAMKPERFKDSDASFNMGAAVAATSSVPASPAGSVVVCMGGNVIDCMSCKRDLETGFFVSMDS